MQGWAGRKGRNMEHYECSVGLLDAVWQGLIVACHQDVTIF
jgi:hypothetical protein